MLQRINNIFFLTQIKGVQLNCQVNKDLSRRVKPVPSVTWARGVIIHDIRQLLKIIEVFDKKGQIWQYKVKEESKKVEEGEKETMEATNKEEEIVKVRNDKKPAKQTLRFCAIHIY